MVTLEEDMIQVHKTIEQEKQKLRDKKISFLKERVSGLVKSPRLV
jgi:hypothetical protein